MNEFSDKVAFIWSVAELVKDYVGKGDYRKIILPFTVLRRVDSVLAPTRAAVRSKNQELALKGLQNPEKALRAVAGFAFYNTSLYDFPSLAADSTHLAQNLRNYVAGFSPNMVEIFQRFNFDNTVTQLDDAGLLFKVMRRFNEIDLHPDVVPNHDMGLIFEELLRRFNEDVGIDAGQFFTPREVVRLMVDLMLGRDRAELADPKIARSVYDPCCGTGGMLTGAKARIQSWNPDAQVHLFGQEVHPETWSTAKADLLVTASDGRDADNIAYGSVLRQDAFAGRPFDYIIANPPYGKDWKQDQEAVDDEAAKGDRSRFPAGLPRISDGQLLFLQHMLTKMRPSVEHGSRVAIIMNGSPLFTGDAGGGESEVRRWVLEHDWLEAIVALPEQIFYNTSIGTYVWVLTNRKEPARIGKVQLVDATSFWRPMKKSLGDKRRELGEADIARICDLVDRFEETEHSRIYSTTHFGHRKITVERPLRLNFQASPERIRRLERDPVFLSLAASKAKDSAARAKEQADGRAEQEAIRTLLPTLPGALIKDRESFERAIVRGAKAAGLKLRAPVMKAIIGALAERDDTAEICRDKDGNPEPDASLRDTELVPLADDIHPWFAREVTPYVSDAWINESVRDDQDGEIGKVGYEINFNLYFYRYQPPRLLEEIEVDITKVEREILNVLGVRA